MKLSARRADIDLLRALAVITVVFYHAGYTWAASGYLGVDVFFVISGYLVAQRAKTVSTVLGYLYFVKGRIRRIFPALVVVLALTTLVVCVVLYPPEIKQYSQELFAAIFQVSNFLFAYKSGYFDPGNDSRILLHTWSLGVEWSFYLLLPIFFVLISRAEARHRLLLAIFVLTLSVLFAVIGAKFVSDVYLFYMLPFRLWEFMVGVLLVYVSRSNNRASVYSVILGFVCIMVGYSIDPVIDDFFVPRMFVVAGTGLIIFAQSSWLERGGAITRVAGTIGLASYSIYLVHQPIFVLARLTTDFMSIPIINALFVVLAFIIGYLVYKFVEVPSGNRNTVSDRKLAKYVLCATLPLVLMSLTGHFSRGFDVAFEKFMSDREYNIINSSVYTDSNEFTCVFQIEAFDDSALGRILDCRERKGPGFVFIGDSHSLDYFHSVARSANEDDFIVGAGVGGCRFTDDLSCYTNDFISLLTESRNIFHTVFYTQAGFYLFQNSDQKLLTRETSSLLYTRDSITPSNDAIAKVIVNLASIDSNRLVILGPWVEPRINVTFARKHAVACELEESFIPSAKVDKFFTLDTVFESQISHRDSELYYVSLTSAIHTAEMGSIQVWDCEGVKWRDFDHLSMYGEQFYSNLFYGLVTDLLKENL